MLSFESSTSAPEGKLFFLGALAGLAKAGAARVGAGAARVGLSRPAIARVGSAISKAPIKSLGGVTLSPSFQKNTTTNTSTTTTSSNDTYINSTINKSI